MDRSTFNIRDCDQKALAATLDRFRREIAAENAGDILEQMEAIERERGIVNREIHDAYEAGEVDPDSNFITWEG